MIDLKVQWVLTVGFSWIKEQFWGLLLKYKKLKIKTLKL
tara:strand:- start:10041 stop:10157 length:117 start_codon:yes stop_codon:yes gene_type:complete